MSTSEQLTEALVAEFVIQHRAGGNDAAKEYLADFLDRELRWVESGLASHMLPLDLALIRWSVVCERWSKLSSRSAPTLGSFLGGFYSRCVGIPLPAHDHILRDSLATGWRQADEQTVIHARKEVPPA